VNPAEFAARFAVSRETQDRLEAFAALLLRWNARINLIGRSTESQLWTRHMADSAQLWALRPKILTHWVDMGAGAGFPGLVIAALAQADAPDLRVTLVESDVRKCAFLAEAARAMDIHPVIRAERIEATPPLQADVLSARALAPLEILVEYVTKHRRPDGIGLFPKGEAVHKEMEAAAKRWRFEYRIHPSVTESQGAIVEVGAVSSV
jgi:16S rRNA (guanine527-N7)-methyltransferase